MAAPVDGVDGFAEVVPAGLVVDAGCQIVYDGPSA